MLKARALVPVEDPGDSARSRHTKGRARVGTPQIHHPKGQPAYGHANGDGLYVGVRPPVDVSASPERMLESLLWNPRCMLIQPLKNQNGIPEAVLDLAEQMLENKDLLEEVIETLRKSIPAKKFTFSVSIDHKSRDEQRRLAALLNEMVGIVANVYLSTTRPVTISGRLVSSSRGQSFITGRYVEFALYKKAREIVSRLAREKNTSWHVFRNVMITNPENVIINEFDLVIEFAGDLYVVEIKSGKNFTDFDKYIQIVKNYGVENRFLLVGSALGGAQAQRIEYFCGYYVSNLEKGHFKKKLTEMLEAGWAARQEAISKAEERSHQSEERIDANESIQTIDLSTYEKSDSSDSNGQSASGQDMKRKARQASAALQEESVSDPENPKESAAKQTSDEKSATKKSRPDRPDSKQPDSVSDDPSRSSRRRFFDRDENEGEDSIASLLDEEPDESDQNKSRQEKPADLRKAVKKTDRVDEGDASSQEDLLSWYVRSRAEQGASSNVPYSLQTESQDEVPEPTVEISGRVLPRRHIPGEETPEPTLMVRRLASSQETEEEDSAWLE